MIIEIIAAFWVSFSFGILFNIKGKYLFLSGIGGSLGWFIYKLSLSFSLSESVAFFISAICFSIYCEVCARISHTPTTILSVCALIPLVPGYGIYNCIYNYILGNYMQAIDYGVVTLCNAGALALGVIFISTIFRGVKAFNCKGKFL